MQIFRRFSFRYSLRVLLLCTALLALWMGVKANRAHKDRIAVRLIEEVGGIVIYDYMLAQRDAVRGDLDKAVPPGPEWLRQVVGDEYFMHPVGLVFREGVISDAGLERVKLFSDLKQIDLYERNITDEGVSHLANIEGLEYLNLDGNRITDKGLSHLTSLKTLSRLHLDNNLITDDALMQLSSLKNLTILCVRGNRVTKEGITRLQRALPELKIFCDFGSISTVNIIGNSGYGAQFSASAD